jgi:hypothetical protein
LNADLKNAKELINTKEKMNRKLRESIKKGVRDHGVRNVTIRNFNLDKEISKEEVIHERLDINTKVMYASMIPVQDMVDSISSKRSCSHENPRLKNAELTGELLEAYKQKRELLQELQQANRIIGDLNS